MIKTGIENTPVPRDYRYIGQCGLKSSPVWDFYSWKWPAGEDYYAEERWKSFDENARLAYKKYINSGDFISVHGRMFKKNIGGLRDELYQRLTEKDTLEEFPCITYAEVQGYSGKLGKLESSRQRNSWQKSSQWRDSRREKSPEKLYFSQQRADGHLSGAYGRELRTIDGFCVGND